LRRHGSPRFIRQGELIELAGCRTQGWFIVGGSVEQPLVAVLAGRVEIRPAIGKPVVAWMVAPLGDSPLGPKVVDVPAGAVRDLDFAVGALAVEELVEGCAGEGGSPDILTLGMIESFLDCLAFSLLGEAAPVCRREDRLAILLVPRAIDEDQQYE